MKLDFQYGGLDNVLNIIRNDLQSTLNAKKIGRKRELIYHALGAVDTLWNLTVEVEESDECGVTNAGDDNS